MVEQVGDHVQGSQCYTASRTSLAVAPAYDQRCEVPRVTTERLNVMNISPKPHGCLTPVTDGGSFELGRYA
jgi:hypothetical protein